MVNSRSMDELEPSVKSRMISFIAKAEMALTEHFPENRWKVIPTCTLRDRAYQEKLYAQGRTSPGAIVTNAKPGQSVHEYGCAMDFAVERDGVVVWDKALYEICGREGITEGLTWGGDWNANGVMDKADWDLAHVQWTDGLTLAQLQQGERPSEA